MLAVLSRHNSQSRIFAYRVISTEADPPKVSTASKIYFGFSLLNPMAYRYGLELDSQAKRTRVENDFEVPSIALLGEQTSFLRTEWMGN